MLYNSIACFSYNFNILGASWNHVFKNVRGVGRMPQKCNVIVRYAATHHTLNAIFLRFKRNFLTGEGDVVNY